MKRQIKAQILKNDGVLAVDEWWFLNKTKNITKERRVTFYLGYETYS